MTIIEAINRTDDLNHNDYSQGTKILWLSNVEAMIKRLVIDTHEGWEDVVFEGFTDMTPVETKLIAQEPFDILYIRYLQMQIDLNNHDLNHYNQSAELFHAAFEKFTQDYHRNHLPRCAKKGFYQGGIV